MSAITTVSKLDLLHKAVLAKVVHWAAREALEKLYIDPQEIANGVADKLDEFIENMAAGYPGNTSNPNPDCMEDDHVKELDKIFGRARSKATVALKKEVLHTAVFTKVAYWDSMLTLEQAYKPSEDVSDDENDGLHDLVDVLAEDYAGSAEQPAPESITESNVKDMDAIFAE
jgi:hypothetical protein